MESQPGVSFDDTEVAFSYKSDRDLWSVNFIFSVVNYPWISNLSSFMVRLGFALRLPVEGLIRRTVFQHFCGGETIHAAESTIRHLARYGVSTILDYSVEGEQSEDGFEQTASEILK